MEYLASSNGLVTPDGPICDGLEGCAIDYCSIDICSSLQCTCLGIFICNTYNS